MSRWGPDSRSADSSIRGLPTSRVKASWCSREAGLVRDRHEGRQTHYSAQLAALAPLVDWTGKMTGFWQNRFNQLEDLLKRMDQ